MLQHQWCIHLIQVDIESTKEMNPEYASNAQFWCVFLAKHPDYIRLSDELSRWWPE